MLVFLLRAIIMVNKGFCKPIAVKRVIIGLGYQHAFMGLAALEPLE